MITAQQHVLEYDMNETKYKQIQQLSSALAVILLHHSRVCITYWKFDLQSGNNITAINCEMKTVNVTQGTQNVSS